MNLNRPEGGTQPSGIGTSEMPRAKMKAKEITWIAQRVWSVDVKPLVAKCVTTVAV